MILDDGDHLMASAGHPQYEPGAWPTRFIEHLNYHAHQNPSGKAGALTLWRAIQTWRGYRGELYCNTPHAPIRQPEGDVCGGCLAVQRIRRGKVQPHDPAPPQHHWCPVCNYPLPAPSYTWAPHPDCAQDGPDDVWAEGYEPATTTDW